MALRRRYTAVVLFGALALLLGARVAGGTESAKIRVTATINGRDVDRIDANRPLRLRATTGAIVNVQVLNKTDEPLTVGVIRLHGKVMNLTFYSYDTLVDMRLDPHQFGEREFLVDLYDIRGQATGLLPGRLTLLSDEHRVLASTAFPVDVRGSLASVYGIFGVVVGVITILLAVAALVRLAGHRLPRNRWKRATRFAVPGLGVGLMLTFSLSAFRVLLPEASKWLPLVLIGGAAGFVVGYLTPTPEVRYVLEEEAAS